jgi:dihydrofolate reductase
MIKAILACDDNWGIGKNGDLPWPYNSADLKWFKTCTNGGVVVMGRKTWESLPQKPLPGRLNYVITSDPNIEPGYHGRFISKNIGRAIRSTIQWRIDPELDIWIIGGAQLIKSTLDIIEEIHLSRIKGIYECDTFLPKDLIGKKFKLKTSEQKENIYIEIWKKYETIS